MPDVAIAVAVHVVAILWWIGGLAFVCFSFLPALRADRLGEKQAAFKAIEHRFEPQARAAVVLAGASGIYLLVRLHLWGWFLTPQFWWLDAMAAYWLLFMAMLFVLGPSGLLRKIMKGSAGDPVRGWRRMHRIHLILLAIGIAIVAGGVLGNHGL